MTITVKVIADSISPDNVRLTTFQVRYPRMIHSELMTHRAFSRNGRSSRAVPVATLIKEDPYVPHFMMNRPGMRASEEMSDDDRHSAEEIWLSMVAFCKDGVRQLNDLKVHKQWANRPLEWFGYIDVLISSTDWANFFALRDEAGAQPEIDEVAKQIKVAFESSTPIELRPGDWHLPFIDYVEDTKLVESWLDGLDSDRMNHYGFSGKMSHDILMVLRRISVARCARLTIKPFDGDASIEKEINRYELLMISRPVHASPAEHIATPDTPIIGDIGLIGWENESEHGNFYGWRQFRKMIPYNTIYDNR